LRKKNFLFSLVGVLVAFSMIFMVNAETDFSCRNPSAVGAGIFIEEHEDGVHNHYFVFSVSDGCVKRGS
jgi:hypothetical protein